MVLHLLKLHSSTSHFWLTFMNGNDQTTEFSTCTFTNQSGILVESQSITEILIISENEKLGK